MQPGPATNSTPDAFSWAVFDAKLNNALDFKLHDVAKKADLSHICAEIQLLRDENVQLKGDLEVMKSRLEHIEQFSKRSSIVVTGLEGKHVKPAIEEFLKLSSTVLQTSVNVTEARKLSSGNAFVFTLNSALEADAVIASRTKLKGSKIYIQKDTTAIERNKMYNLRQLSKCLQKFDGSLKIRNGHSRIYINDKMYSWSNGNVVASKAADVDFLQSLLAKANYACNVVLNNNNAGVSTTVAESSASYSNASLMAPAFMNTNLSAAALPANLNATYQPFAAPVPASAFGLTNSN